MTDQQLIEDARGHIANRYDTDYKLLIRCFEAVVDRFAALQSENAEKDKEIERLKSELLEAREDYMASEMEREQGVAALSCAEAERDAGRPSAEVLEVIDELVEFARDRMSIGMWLGYVNVLNEWRGAQGER